MVSDLKMYIGETVKYKGFELIISEISKGRASLMSKEGNVASVSLEKLNSMIFVKKRES